MIQVIHSVHLKILNGQVNQETGKIDMVDVITSLMKIRFRMKMEMNVNVPLLEILMIVSLKVCSIFG